MGLDVSVRISGDASGGAAAIDVIIQRLGKMEQGQTKAAKSGMQLSDALGQVNGVLGTLGLGVSIAGIAQVGMALEQAGAQVQTAKYALDQLTEGKADQYIDSVRVATHNTTSELDAARSATFLLSSGMAKNTEEVGKFARVAATLGGAFQGLEAGDAIKQFSLLLSNESLRRLDTFGIGVAQVKDRMAELEAQGMDHSRAFFEATMEIASVKADQLNGVLDQQSGKLDRLGAAWNTFFARQGEGFAESMAPTVDAFTTIVEGFNNVDSATKAQKQHLMDTTDSFEEYLDTMRAIPVLSSEVVRSGRQTQNTYSDLRAEWEANHDAILSARAAQMELTSAQRDNAEVTVDWTARANEAAAAITNVAERLTAYNEALETQAALQLRTEQQVSELTGLWWGAGQSTKGTKDQIDDLSQALAKANDKMADLNEWGGSDKSFGKTQQQIDELTGQLEDASQQVDYMAGQDMGKIFEFAAGQMSQMNLSATQMLDKFNELGLATGQVTELQIAQGTALRELDNLYAQGTIGVDSYIQGLSQIPAAQDAATASSIATKIAITELAESYGGLQNVSMAGAMALEQQAKQAASGVPESAQSIADGVAGALDKINALPGAQLKLLPDDALKAIDQVSQGINTLAATNFDPARVTADIGDVDAKTAQARSLIDSIKDKTVTITVNLQDNTGGGGPAAPGVPGEQHGTSAARGGLTMVGEAGPELLNLPGGTPVWSKAELAGILGGLGGGGGGDTFLIQQMIVQMPNEPSLTEFTNQVKRQARPTGGN